MGIVYLKKTTNRKRKHWLSCASFKLKTFALQNNIKKMKKKPQTGKRYLEDMYQQRKKKKKRLVCRLYKELSTQ